MPDVQKDVLRRLATVIDETQCDLERAAHDGRINAVAWLTRNLLELMIWTHYCIRSENNAKEFLMDAGRDLTDTLRTVSRIAPDPTQPKAALEDFKESVREMGVESIEERYTAVAKAAEEVGKAEAFRDVNKLLSKFAHPTALSTLYTGNEGIENLKLQFYRVGKRLAQESLYTIAMVSKT